ncbi:ABC transporter permease [Pseudonocardia xinjiangensis]|uniref:ABC transporter permease n=1 Tax=Pseudonocardia xinjiangensis TaxID=75289 RepID=A0ABX1RQE2_9PSEU|nr:ABC transporter permease [Pseudonocardia xinjiangensis]NMH82192.1 ABC transporter permease [Pseudonocardia xinjiangensis]
MGALLLAEVRRLLRSPRFLIFTVGFPVVYLIVFTGIFATGPDAAAATAVLMINMAAFGAISASISTGGRVAVERSIGWNRQLRLTPLPAWGYVATKAAVAMLVALPALLLVFAVARVVEGVHLDALTWVRVFLAAWIGVLPFAAIGLLLGLVATPDSAQGMSTVTMLVFSLLGGVLIPAQVLPSGMLTVAHLLPSYWLTAIAQGQASGAALPIEGVAVVLGWLLVAGAAVAVRYRRDALRV